MGNGMARGYGEYRPANEQDQSFDDPPRSWPRVGALAGAWVIVLALGAWMVPAVAAGGPGDDGTAARDRPATDPIGAAWRYLKYGSDNDAERFEAAMCDGADPQIGIAQLTDLRYQYEEQLGGYPEVEVEAEVISSGESGAVLNGLIQYLYRGRDYEESFNVTVQSDGDSYCVAEAVYVEPPPDGGPNAVDLDYLRFIVWDRDISSAEAIQCEQYVGPEAGEILDAVESWGDPGNDVTAIAVPQNGSPEPNAGVRAPYPYYVELESGQVRDTVEFQVVILGDCVVELSGGEGLLGEIAD